LTRRTDEAAGRHPRAVPLAAAGAFGLALLPLFLPGGRRPLPLAEATLGCYPWTFMPGTGPSRARAIGPDARWFQVWKHGDVMKIPIRDMRDPRFEERFRLDVTLNGERVLEGWPLPHHTRSQLAENPKLEANPQAYLRFERPAGVEPGDLVELHLSSSGFYVGSYSYHADFRRVTARIWPGFFQ
jgi:hypothetical protein